MLVKVLKDWSDYKNGTEINLNDENVIKKGLEIGLFETVKEKKETKK